MADGMTKGEIEDVLSSIRRLVSDGNRPLFRAAPRPFAREAEKLILTPALRVQPAGDRAAPSRFVLREEPQADRPTLGTVVTAIAAAVPREVAEWEPETGDAFAAAQDRAPWTDDLPPPAAPAPGDADLLVEAIRPRPDAAAPAPEAPVWEDEVEDDGWEVEEADAALDYASAAPPHAPEAAEAPPPVDAAILAEMIRTILREELRGPLGERITGSLRKLVRAEVARALTLRGEA